MPYYNKSNYASYFTRTAALSPTTGAVTPAPPAQPPLEGATRLVQGKISVSGYLILNRSLSFSHTHSLSLFMSLSVSLSFSLSLLLSLCSLNQSVCVSLSPLLFLPCSISFSILSISPLSRSLYLSG